MYLHIFCRLPFADDNKPHNEIKFHDDNIKLQVYITSLVKWNIKWVLGFDSQKSKMVNLLWNTPCYRYKNPNGDNVRILETTDCETYLWAYVDFIL